MEHGKLWTLIELKSSELNLKTVLEFTDPELTMVLASEQDFDLLNKISKKIPPGNILIRPSTWNNAAALLVQLLEIEKRDRFASVLYWPVGSECQPQKHLPPNWIDALRSVQQGSARVHVLRWGRSEATLAESPLLASVSTFLLLYMITQAELLRPFLRKFRSAHPGAESQAFEYVSTHDFCKDVLQPNPHFLKHISHSSAKVTPMNNSTGYPPQLEASFRAVLH